MITKYCKRCQRNKPIECFTLRGNGYYVSNCKACEVERVREYEAKNPNRRSQYDRDYRLAHQSEKNAYFRERRKQHPEKVRAYESTYRGKNGQRINARLRNYYAENPFIYKAIAHRYLGHKHSASGTHSKEDIAELFDLQDGRCAYCGMPVINYQIDHIRPLSRNGSNDPSNLAIACKSCNASKKDKMLWEWQGRFIWMKGLTV